MKTIINRFRLAFRLEPPRTRGWFKARPTSPKQKTDHEGRLAKVKVYAGYAFGRYPRPAPCERAPRSLGGVCVPVSSALHLGKPVQRETDVSKTKNRPRGSVFVLEVTAGFEPADNGVADRYLVTLLIGENR